MLTLQQLPYKLADTKSMSISILLADDHPVIRNGLRQLLSTQAEFEVVAVVDNGQDAVEQVANLVPDIAILDITMPRLNGIEAARQIKERQLETRIIILSMHATTAYLVEALAAGVRGYVLKEAANTDLIQAVHEVLAGRLYVSPKIPGNLGVINQLKTRNTAE